MLDQKILQEDALKIAEVIHEYAESKGWAADDYHVFMTIRPDLYILPIKVVARACEGRSMEQGYQDFAEIMDFLGPRIKREDHNFNYYSLLLTGQRDYSFLAYPRLRPEEYALDERLINRGVAWSAPYQIKSTLERAQ